LGGKQGSGNQWMSWVTIDDMVSALRFFLENDAATGAVNVVAPNPVTNADFATTLGRVLHRPTVLPTPLFVLKAQYGAELVETLLLFSQRVSSAQLESLGFRFTYPVLHPALEHAVGR
jgi:NAD dependent epimerase/dehydratase family enzyme